MMKASKGDDSITTYRLALHRAGHPPIPVHGPEAEVANPGKRPAPIGWEHLTDTDEDEIRGWRRAFESATNTGILTRNTPVIDIDIDDEELADEIEELVRSRLGDAPKRIGKAPRRSLFYRTERPFPKLIAKWKVTRDGVEAKEGVEILCDGQQCVVDGVHPDTGERFFWPNGDLADEWPRDELTEIDEELARAVLGDVRALAEGRGLFVSNVPEGAPGPAPAAPEAIIQGERNVQLASLAGSMRRRGMQERAIFEALKATNADQCRPMLDEDELRRIAKSVSRYEPAGVPSDPLVFVHGHQERDFDAKSIVAEMSISKLLSEPAPPVPTLLDELLPERVVGAWIGTGGVGKTTLLCDLALSVATGKLFLDTWAPSYESGAQVLMLAKEDDLDDLHRMFSRVCSQVWRTPRSARSGGMADRLMIRGRAEENLAVGSLLGYPTQLVTQGAGGKIDVAPFAKRLRELIEARQEISGEALRLLILDPLSRFRSTNENDANAATQLVDLLDEIREEYGTTVILSHHTSKSDPTSPRGSGALVDGMRWAWSMARVTVELAERMQLDPSQARKLVIVDNPKNSKLPECEKRVITRNEEGGFEMLGRLVDLLDEDSNPSLYVREIEGFASLLEEELAEGRRYTQRSAREMLNDQAGLSKDRIRELINTALITGRLILVPGKIGGQSVEFVEPRSKTLDEG